MAFDEDPFDQEAALKEYAARIRKKDRAETDQNREIYELGRADAEESAKPVTDSEPSSEPEPAVARKDDPRPTSQPRTVSRRGSDAAGVILGFYVYVGFLVPYLRSGAVGVRQWHRAKFFNAPDAGPVGVNADRYAQAQPEPQPQRQPSSVVAISGD